MYPRKLQEQVCHSVKLNRNKTVNKLKNSEFNILQKMGGLQGKTLFGTEGPLSVQTAEMHVQACEIK